MSRNKSNDEQVSLKGTELEELRRFFQAIVDLRDRKYGFPSKTYESCFVGSEAVNSLIEKGLAADEDDAVRLGNVMLHGGIFHHVQRAHTFKNEYFFYRFASDEDHGGLPDEIDDGSSVKWADFLGVLTARKDTDNSLQPSVPEPDAELGRLDQIDLDAIGVSPFDEHNAKILDNVYPVIWVALEAVERVKASMQHDGVTFTFNSSYKRVENGTGKNLKFDALPIATSRKPAVVGLVLETVRGEFDT